MFLEKDKICCKWKRDTDSVTGLRKRLTEDSYFYTFCESIFKAPRLCFFDGRVLAGACRFRRELPLFWQFSESDCLDCLSDWPTGRLSIGICVYIIFMTPTHLFQFSIWFSTHKIFCYSLVYTARTSCWKIPTDNSFKSQLATQICVLKKPDLKLGIVYTNT